MCQRSLGNAVLLGLEGVLVLGLLASARAADLPRFQALRLPPPSQPGSTWAILDRDGANRRVPKYLSSLGGGELGTGVIASPPFVITGDRIKFTICGHDGSGGGRRKNFVALVDTKTNRILQQTFAPGNDALQERVWEVGPLRGRKVQVEVHDGLSEGGFAWLGIGRIDAGEALGVDFSRGMPADWAIAHASAERPTEVVAGAVPFLRYTGVYTVIPQRGELELECGFSAKRLFLLGCTVAGGRPLEQYGEIDLVYAGGLRQQVPLVYGFTLDADGKQLLRSPAMYLHPSADPFQHYLVIEPRGERIEKIVLRRSPKRELVPRVTAITCEGAAASDHLAPLSEGELSAAEAAWIDAHAIRPASPDRREIEAEIRRVHRVK